MPADLDLRNPVLANTLGHAAGVLIYAIFIAYFLRDRHVREHSGGLPLTAAALALAWNLGSFVVLALGTSPATPYIAEPSYVALSLLPAVLLHAFLERRDRILRLAGYGVSFTSAALHATELIAPGAARHDAALIAITMGFGALAPLAAFLASRRRSNPGGGPRLMGTIYLVLLAISFVHFGAYHEHRAWPFEVVIHHMGIPLALLMLLQSIRFLLLDAFIVVVANGALAAVFTYLVFAVERNYDFFRQTFSPGFGQAIPIIGTSLILIAFAVTLRWLRSGFDRLLFHRADVTQAMAKLEEVAAAAHDEESLLSTALPVVAAFTGAERYAQQPTPPGSRHDRPDEPMPVSDAPGAIRREHPWAELVAPLRFSRGDGRRWLLGPRAGGRRYLSGDLAALARLCGGVVGHVDRLRQEELKRLATESELRALQSQINPHFLFNALNAVYGAIPKAAANAREAVLNLSEILRYSLRSSAGLVRLSQEIEVVRAYLHLEALRLGSRLKVEIEMDETTGKAQVPALSIQPLVENAVKHGIGKKEGPGTVRVSVKRANGAVRIEVTDTGNGFHPDGNRAGLGLENVRRRLRLYFGAQSELRIRSSPAGACVGFDAPFAGPDAATSLDQIRERAPIR